MKSSTAALRLFTREPDTSFIRDALGTEATHITVAGTPVSSRNPSGPKHEETIWILESGKSDECELSEHIAQICELIGSRSERLLSIRPRLIEADVFCMYSSEDGQGMCSIQSKHMKVLGAHEVDIVIDLYPPV